jgi:hypothetical protein
MTIKKIIRLAAIAGPVIGAVLCAGFIAIQFIPIDRDNPPVVQEPDWDSPRTRALMERACFDCHSNETNWPWYSNVVPVSWGVANDVHEGREKLNFSEWGRSEDPADEDKDDNDEEEEAAEEAAEAAEEMVDEIRKGEMPLPRYLLLHPEARLTDAEIEQLIQGIEATFGSSSTFLGFNESR